MSRDRMLALTWYTFKLVWCALTTLVLRRYYLELGVVKNLGGNEYQRGNEIDLWVSLIGS